MTYRTILVHCDVSAKLSPRLEVAVDLAQRFGANLVGVHVQVPIDVPAVSAGVMWRSGGYQAAARAEHDTAFNTFEEAIKGSDVRTEWRLIEGFHAEELVVQCRYADLLIVGQAEPESETLTPGTLPETVAISSARPVLVVPHIGVRRKPGKSIMLCWSASRESVRAATEALPFLVSAEKVVVLIVETRQLGRRHKAEPGTDVAAWLARQGVNATVQREVAADADVGEVILSRAADHDSDLIVMGLYGHSRLREVILGGASRTLLSSMTVPVLMAH